MALGYRTVLTTDATSDNRDKVLEILRLWVTRRKKFPSMPTSGAVESAMGATLTASQYSNEDSSGFRWELIEEWSPPPRENVVSTTRSAVMHITLVSSAGRLWFWVDIEPPTLTVQEPSGRTREEIQYTGTPAFVSDVIDAVEMQDGEAEPFSGFQTIPTASYVDKLLRVVQDETRLGAVFVTAPPNGGDIVEWTKKSNERSYAMQGLGVGYVLSSEALSAFNSQTAFGHSIPPGGMRTFVPGAKLGDPQDAFNHKLMYPSTLRDTDERRVRRILRNAQIQRLRGIRLPLVLRDADYEFLRMRRLQPFEVLHREAPEVQTSTSSALNEVADLRQRLADAEKLALEAFDHNRSLVDERDLARDEAELERIDADDFYTKFSERTREIQKLSNRVEYLRKELTEHGGGAAAWTFIEEDDSENYPATFAELLEKVQRLPGVRFTGDVDETIELDGHPGLGEAVVMKAWDALVTFDAYCRARNESGFDHSFSHYVTHANHGHYVQVGKIVWSESESVKKNEKYRSERMLPVDPKVDPSGETFMVAHVKLSNLTGIAPRMYFEDTYSLVGYVTVGYLGSHMTNTLTN